MPRLIPRLTVTIALLGAVFSTASHAQPAAAPASNGNRVLTLSDYGKVKKELGDEQP